MQTGMKKRGVRILAGALLRALVVILLVSLAVFFLIRLVPGDPAVMILGERASEQALTELREQLGLNLPLHRQFLAFMRNLFLHADTGASLQYGISSRDLVLSRAPVTLLLVLLTTVLTAAATVSLSFAAAGSRGKTADHLVRILPAVTQGMPVFWTGLLFILAFAVHLHIFPAGGTGEGPFGLLYSLVLPALTVSFGQIPPLVRSLRERLLSIYSSDFVLTLRSAGLPEKKVRAHILRNAFVPTLMLFSVNLSYLIGGTLVVEQVFGIRGVGKLLFDAVSHRDFPLVQAIALYCAVFVVLISLLTDLIAHRADPRTEDAA